MAVIAEIIHPFGQEILIVEGLVIKHIRPRAEGQQQKQNRNDPRAAELQSAGAFEKPKRKKRLKKQKKIDHKTHTIPPKKKKAGKNPTESINNPLTKRNMEW